MNKMTETPALRRRRQAEDDAFGGVRRNARGAGRYRRVWHRRLRLHGCARSVPARRHPFHFGRPRAGRGAHGRRLRAGVGAPRRLHRAKRAGRHQFRHRDGRRLLGALAGGRDHPGDRIDDARPGGIPGNRAAADLCQDHPLPGARQQPRAHGRTHRARVRPRAAGNGTDAAQHTPRFLLRRHRVRDSASDRDRARPGWRARVGRRRGAARGVALPGDRLRRRRRHGRRPGRGHPPRRTAPGAGMQLVSAQRLVSRAASDSPADRSATRAPRRR